MRRCEICPSGGTTTVCAVCAGEASPALATISTILPMHTVSEANRRDHWTLKAVRVKRQRSMTYYHLREWLQTVPELPMVITLTRVAPRALDTDNLPPSLKAVQDGVADWLGCAYGKGNDRQPGLTWQYAQERGKRHAVEITIRRHCAPTL